jgi:hypothetical protein
MRITLVAIGMAVLLSAGSAMSEDAKPGAEKAPAKAGAEQGNGTKSAKADPKKNAAKGKASGPSDEQIADQLKGFCVKWMGFLETRERDNKKAIKWEKKPTGFAGHYVGYSKEYDCTMKERSSNGTPVATIEYKEFVYEKQGASQTEAEQDEAAPVDATEVTEIFRYSKGQWVY